MITAFLTAKAFLGAPRWMWLAIGLLLFAALWLVWWTETDRAEDEANQEIGRTVEREEAQAVVIEQVKEANDAREDNRRRTDTQRHADCVSRSRTPQNC